VFGKELILDLERCELPCNRVHISDFMIGLCHLIKMEREDLHFWDYAGDPEGYEKAEDHLKGISACQFIKTSNIIIHTIDVPKKVFLNIFSCKDYDHAQATRFSANWFGGIVNQFQVVERS